MYSLWLYGLHLLIAVSAICSQASDHAQGLMVALIFSNCIYAYLDTLLALSFGQIIIPVAGPLLAHVPEETPRSVRTTTKRKKNGKEHYAAIYN